MLKARIAGRLVQGVLTLLLASVLVFGVVSLSGDPVALMLGPIQDTQRAEFLRERLALDRPVHQQYLTYLGQVVRGDLGHSYAMGTPVATLLWQRLPRSLILAAAAFVIACAIAIPTGVYSAVHRGSWFDRGVRYVAVVGQAAPAFWVGALLLLLFSVRLGWFPVLTLGGLGSPRNWVLPGVTLSLFLATAMLRLIRSGMLEVLDSEYIKLAHIKGVARHRVIWKHAFRNAVLSVLTFTGQYVGLIVTVAIVVEKVFAWPGLGMLGYEAILRRDVPLIQGFVLVSTFLVVTSNMAVDLLYARLDPRTAQ
jgi:ABC-type dipeptide/oligopeptide/nickel transport system permease component